MKTVYKTAGEARRDLERLGWTFASPVWFYRVGQPRMWLELERGVDGYTPQEPREEGVEERILFPGI